MFSKQELQVIGQTMTQRRDWLLKAIKNPEYAAAQTQNEKTLEIIESTLVKITGQFREKSDSDEGGSDKSPKAVNHYISAKSTSPIRQAALKRRLELQAKDLKVLVVDDDQLICDLLSAFLSEAGILRIDTAFDGMKGIGVLYDASSVYDLVLCDWNMPNKSGLEVHDAMRASERYHGTVFMLVTGVTEAKQIRAAIDEGVDDYVVKPLEQEKLIGKITRFFPKLLAGVEEV
jgi:two-component system, chemotaxis family, chemotaxis protein CheY